MWTEDVNKATQQIFQGSPELQGYVPVSLKGLKMKLLSWI